MTDSVPQVEADGTQRLRHYGSKEEPWFRVSGMRDMSEFAVNINRLLMTIVLVLTGVP